MPRRTISLEDMDKFEVGENGQLFWRGKAVVLERRITLKGIELIIALLAAAGAVAAGVHPFLVSFGFLTK